MSSKKSLTVYCFGPGMEPTGEAAHAFNFDLEHYSMLKKRLNEILDRDIIIVTQRCDVLEACLSFTKNNKDNFKYRRVEPNHHGINDGTKFGNNWHYHEFNWEMLRGAMAANLEVR